MPLNTIKTHQIEDSAIAEIDIADNSISNVKIAALSSSKLSGALPALNGSALTSLTAANLVGDLPVMDGTTLTGITTDFTPLENQMSRLGLHLGAVGQLTKFNMIDQVIDDYEDATGVVAYNGVAAIPAVSAYQDASSSSRTVTSNGGAAISTTQKKFGTHSLTFDGSNDHFTIPAHADTALGTSDFTIEFWFYGSIHTAGSRHTFISNRPSGTSPNTCYSMNQYNVSGGNFMQFDAWNASIVNCNGSFGSAFNTPVNTWTHIAVTSNSRVLKIWFDGVERATNTNPYTFTQTEVLAIGKDIFSGNMLGSGSYMDEIRMSDICRYTATFTPSTTAFESDSNTILLIHGESQSAADAVPNTGSSSSATRAGSAGAKYYSGSSNSNQTLLSTTTTAASAVTKADILVQTEDSTGTATINTDVKAGVSRDALNYVVAPLTKISTWGSGNVYAANDVTMPGTVMTKDVTVTAAATILFAYTGADVNWTVPPGVSTATIIAWGAGGGGGSSGGYGGGGGYISGDISVTAGETLVVKVGGAGVHNTGTNYTGVGNGGGGTGIYRSGTVLAIAGAGGGSASSHYGGAGGGTTGGDGAGTYKGLGGTQSAGGAGGAAAGGRPAGNAGSLNQGGHGVLGGSAITMPAAYNGGGTAGGDLTNYTSTGGGGGYYGGGSGGSGANGSGGGGSSLTAGTNTQATTYTPAQTGHANYPGGNVGYGGAAGVAGVAGYMVIKTTVASTQFVADDALTPTLELTEGYTYKFDTSDSTNSGHTFKFATAADAAGSTQYTTGVTESGTPGSANAYTQIVVAASAPTLYYYCSNHASMGGTANTPAEAATTSMRYRVDTKNQSASKITRVHGTSLAWS